MPTFSIGANSFIGYSKEVTWGVPINPVTTFIPFDGDSLAAKINPLMPTMIQNQRAKVTRAFRGVQSTGGGFNWAMFPDAGQDLFAGALGTENYTAGTTDAVLVTTSTSIVAPAATTIPLTSVTGLVGGTSFIMIGTVISGLAEVRKVVSIASLVVTVDAGFTRGHASGVAVVSVIAPFTHNITVATSTSSIPSFTLERNVGQVNSFQYAGAFIDKLSLTADNKGELKCAATVLAKDELVLSGGSVSTLTTVTSDPFTFNQGGVLFGAAGQDIGGTFVANTDVETWSCEMSNGCKEEYTFQSPGVYTPTRVIPTVREIKGKLTVYYADTTQYSTYYRAMLGQALQLKYLNASNYGFNLTLPQVRYTELTVPIKFDGWVVQDIGYVAILDPTTGVDAHLQIMNGKWLGY